jgi:hypothetical protein
MAQTIDLRGTRAQSPVQPVLLDLTGQRARNLARLGRAIAVVFVLWLCGLLLAWLGVLPDAIVPLSHHLTGTTAPASLHSEPKPIQPSRADLAPAQPVTLATTVAGLTPRTGTTAGTAGVRGRIGGAVAPGRTPAATRGATRRGHHRTSTVIAGHRGTSATGTTLAAAPVVTTPGPSPASGTSGNSSAAPGHTGTAPGHSGSAGHSNSSTGSATVTTTAQTTAPGNSGTAPGHTGTTPGQSGGGSGNGRGNGH